MINPFLGASSTADMTLEVVSKSSIGFKITAGQGVQPEEYI
jgi:hypothetical protein